MATLFYSSRVNALFDPHRSIQAFAMHICMDRFFPAKGELTPGQLTAFGVVRGSYLDEKVAFRVSCFVIIGGR
jgi:hypothetical protein